MKGIGKAFSRTPHMITSKVGMSKKSLDPEFEDYHRNFAALEVTTEKFLKDVKVFTEAVVALFTAGSGYATHFSAIFHPISGEFDLIGRHPEAGETVRNVDAYQQMMEDVRQSVSPELELIESRVMGPMKEYQQVLKTIRKSITKREHKLMDYDRFNNSLSKLRDKREKSLSDEKNLFKLEQDFELATTDYEAINMAMKQDLPRFLMLSTQFIDPLFHSFFYMQLNIYYMLLEKLQTFAEGKYDVTNVPGAQIAADYEAKRTDAWERIEALGIISRMVSTAKMVAASRSLAPEKSSLGRSASTLSSSSRAAPPGVSRSNTTFSSAAAYKKAPPAPPGSAGLSRSATTVSHAPPPPYTPGGSVGAVAAANAVAGKRAPPPPPPLKPKPQPAVQYVVALYDFAAQADGDLSFSAGDRIEVVERTGSTEDWWTGRLNGRQGVFPGNYVQDT